MSGKSKHSGSAKPRVKVSLIVIAVLAAVTLGILLWFTMELFSKKDSSDSVKLKKSVISSPSSQTETMASQTDKQTETTTTSQTTTQSETATSAVTTTEPSTTAPQTTTTEPSKPALAAVKLGGGLKGGSWNIVLLKWDKVDNASGYYVYRQKDGVWEIAAEVADAENTQFEEILKESGKYVYKVNAFFRDDPEFVLGADGNTISVSCTEGSAKANLYLLPKGTQIFNDEVKLVYTLTEEGYYTGLADKEHKGYLRIDYMFETRMVKESAAKRVNNAVALATSVIGQEGGEIYGSSACGPTSAAVLVRYDRGIVWNKDDLIRYTEKNGLADQGSMMGEVGEGGMSAPMVMKLIVDYSGGEIVSTNVYSDSEKPSVTLKDLIDSGRHSILSVRYAWGIVHHPYSIIHFVEPCAYVVENGKLYFFYGDTAFANGPKGLKKVSAEELDESVSTVNSEPKCIIVLDPPSS